MGTIKLVLVSVLAFSSAVLSAQITEPDSLDEYHVLMFDMIEQLNYGEYDEFMALIDFDRIVETSLSDVPLPEYDKRSLKLGMVTGAKQQFEVSYKNMFDNAGLIQYVNYTETDDFYSILIRFSGEAGLNYIEYVLENDEAGNITIVDFYPFIAGEFVSSTLNRTVKTMLSEDSIFEKLLSGLSNKEKEFTQSLPVLTKMHNLTINGLYEDVRREYEALPPSVQNNKLFILSATSAAQELDDEFYLSLIDRFEKFYPDDPSFPLIILDSYLLRGKIDEAQQQIDVLDEAIGGDNFLNTVRGNIALVGDDSTAARMYFNTALENDIYLEEAYWSLIDLDLSSKNYEAVVKNLNKLVFIFEYYFTEEEFQDEPFLEFSKSNEFAEWIKTQ